MRSRDRGVCRLPSVDEPTLTLLDRQRGQNAACIGSGIDADPVRKLLHVRADGMEMNHHEAMVALILTRPGFDDIHRRMDPTHDATWLNAHVLTEPEITALRNAGHNVTTFAYPLNPADLASAIDTIREHHPGQIIWTEAAAG